MSRRVRIATFSAVCLATVAVAAGWFAVADRDDVPEDAPRVAQRVAAPEAARLTADELLFRNTSLNRYGRLATVPASSGEAVRLVTGLECERVHATRTRGICLRADRGALTRYDAVLFDGRLRTTARIDLAGSPSRARVSPSGRRAAYTVFVTGHSYAAAGFSTRTAIVDATTGTELVELEQLDVLRLDGTSLRAVDRNFWGVTFVDDDRFYATVGTGGRVWLIEGRVSTRRARVLREGIECPSLAPDGRRIAFKRRHGGGLTPVTWRVAVLDLASGTERELAERRNVDDQVEWLDDDHVIYGLAREGSAVTDLWAVSPDGTGKPVRLVEAAWSPAVVRS